MNQKGELDDEDEDDEDSMDDHDLDDDDDDDDFIDVDSDYKFMNEKVNILYLMMIARSTACSEINGKLHQFDWSVWTIQTGLSGTEIEEWTVSDGSGEKDGQWDSIGTERHFGKPDGETRGWHDSGKENIQDKE